MNRVRNILGTLEAERSAMDIDGLADGDPVKASLETITAKLMELAAKLTSLEGISSGRMKRDTTGIISFIQFFHTIFCKDVRV